MSTQPEAPELAEVLESYRMPSMDARVLAAAKLRRLHEEHKEDQRVIAVWRGRTQRAEAQRDALLAALDQLVNGTMIHEHTHNDNGLEELAARCGSAHVATELRKLAGIARAAIAKAAEEQA